MNSEIHKPTRFALALGIQLVIILAIILFKYSVSSGGTEILLKIAPIDPRDPIRGDYITFRYDISNVNVYSEASSFRNGERLYVPLVERGKFFVQYGEPIRSIPKETRYSVIYLKGTVISGGAGEAPTIPNIPNVNQRTGAIRVQPALNVKYGIEEYFIPEGAGINMSFWNKEAAALVAVDERGNAVLKRIYVDDRPWP